MQPAQRVFLVGILVAIVLVGLSAYFFMFFQALHQKPPVSQEQLEQMSKKQLVDYILLKQAEGGPKSGYFFVPIAVFVSALTGVAVSYYLLVRAETASKSARVSAEIILSLLRDDERRIVQLLLDNGGQMRQYELVHMTGLNKVRVHRALKALEDRGVVEIQKIGKVNNVRLRRELYDALRSE